MRHARRAALPAATTLALLAGLAAPAAALKGAPGGAQAPSTPQAGGTEYGVQAQLVPARPVVSALSVPRTATAGSPPRVTFRIAETGVGTVAVRVTVTALSTHTPVLSAVLGWVHTGRTNVVRWPRGATLTPGSYQVSLSAHDHHGGRLLRRAHSSGEASLTVGAAVPPPAQAPVPPAPPVAAPTEAGVPTPAQSVAEGAVFPVAGAHSFGGPENRFGAPREGHVHQGQ
ncbi:MAG TPA: hypothetical protein VEW68_05410, partial [Patescibacteria group bacterium]|nr:hypothetical protein [Patescibacteria group bacterium]